MLISSQQKKSNHTCLCLLKKKVSIPTIHFDFYEIPFQLALIFKKDFMQYENSSVYKI